MTPASPAPATNSPDGNSSTLADTIAPTLLPLPRRRVLPLGLAAALLAFATPVADAETERLTCGLAPPGSLTVLHGTGVLGRALEIGIDNPLGTQAAGSATYLVASFTPTAPSPCGAPAFGLSMFGYGVPGELFVSFDTEQLIGVWPGSAWNGPGTSSRVLLFPAADPASTGTRVDLQGFVIDHTGLGAIAVGATEGLRVTLEAPCSGHAPCFESVSIGARVLDATMSAAEVEGGPVASVAWHASDMSAVSVFAADGSAELAVEGAGAASPTANASGRHVSHLDGRRVMVAMETTAHASGSLFDVQTRARGELWFEFELAYRSRATVDVLAVAQTISSQGYVLLVDDSGQVFNATASNGEFADETWSGWLEPGSYTLIASSLALVHASGADARSTLALELVLRHAADVDGSGVVDAADQVAFAAAFALGLPAADMDGDGDVDASDQAAFDAALDAGGT